MPICVNQFVMMNGEVMLFCGEFMTIEHAIERLDPFQHITPAFMMDVPISKAAVALAIETETMPQGGVE